MQVFITGTDTDIGKTTICTWLCLHTKYSYFKPIQTGSSIGTDSMTVLNIARTKIHPESYIYAPPVSPHFAARDCNEVISLSNIFLPKSYNLIVEGAGGVYVPLNEDSLMIDLIKHLAIPVILVSSSRVGTINHTLLTLEALTARGIKNLGVIVNGIPNEDNCQSIELYGKTKVLAQFPLLQQINEETLKAVPLTPALKKILI